MSTRSKYFRVKPEEEKNEDKADTDIIMRFSPTYGIHRLIQESISPGLSLSSSARTKSSWPSKPPKDLSTGHSGSLRSSEEKYLGFTKSSTSPRKRLLMSLNPNNKDSSESKRKGSLPSSKSPLPKSQLLIRKRLPAIKSLSRKVKESSLLRRSGKSEKRRELRGELKEETGLPEETETKGEGREEEAGTEESKRKKEAEGWSSISLYCSHFEFNQYLWLATILTSFIEKGYFG